VSWDEVRDIYKIRNLSISLLTYVNIREGTSVLWGHYCDAVYVTWHDFDQSHACISR